MARQRNDAQRKHGGTQALSSAKRVENVQTNDNVNEKKLKGGLYLVATPIGNLGDISTRALSVLRSVDSVACEDTRSTGKLLSFFGIRARLLSYHDYSGDKVEETLMERLHSGESMALVSDAGTPLVSDPGFRLVRRCVAENVPVTAVPGASAALTALQLSGLPSDRFFFHGFLPPRTAARQTALSGITAVPGTLIFYESPHRLADSLADMATVLGARPAAVCRELTKLFEEVRRGSLNELAEQYRRENTPKGEVVVVVAPAVSDALSVNEEALDELIREALRKASPRDAAAAIAQKTSLSRRTVYARVLVLTKGVEREKTEQ